MHMTVTASTFAWNGPVCGQCGAHYLGAHTCSREDILRHVTELLGLIDRAPTADRTQSCPCRPENGGSGVCGCILGGPTITCH